MLVEVFKISSRFVAQVSREPLGGNNISKGTCVKFAIVLATSVFLLSCGSHDLVTKDQGFYKMTVSSVPWLLRFPAEGLEPKEAKLTPDSTSGYFLFSEKKPSSIMPLVVSFYIEPSGNCTTAECLRDKAWARLKPTLKGCEDIHLSEIGNAAIVEFSLPANYLQKHMYAHFYKDGYWIDVHLSQAFFNPESRGRLVDFVKSVSFKAKERM